MRLNKIYASKGFKNIEFVDGLNVILGEIVDKGDKNKDTHNLGKTSLINVIDFCLLKKLDKDNFLKKHPKVFKGHVFYLEILLNDGKYLLIKRSVEKSSKISFKSSAVKVTGFPLVVDWDEDEVSFSKAKTILSRFLDFDILAGDNFRAGLSYFLRNQYDYRDVFQLAKFVGKHKDWKPIIFDLLGFDGKVLFKKYELEDEKQSLLEAIHQIEEQKVVDTKEIDKLKGILEIKKEEKRLAEAQVDNFNFYHQDKQVNEELLEKLDAQISSYNSLRYNLTSEIEKIGAVLGNQLPSFDVDAMQELYGQVQIYFPKDLLRQYSDLQEFNVQISTERQKYLSKGLTDCKNELIEVEKSLQELEARKSVSISVLKDKDSYEKFKYYQKELAKAESEIARIEERLEGVEKVHGLEDLIAEKNVAIEKSVKSVKDVVGRGNDFYKEIRKNFHWIVKTVLGAPAVISIPLNSEGNVDFNADVQNQSDLEVTAEGQGTTYKKMLCIAFDLAVLITYSQHSFYRFVYHDGCLEGLDDRKKLNFIALVRDVCKKYGLQYILTIIDSDLPHDEHGKIVVFPDNEVVLRLYDKDESGTLFGESF
jgi:uncharacterized protein YydD (DUF2326 family)